MPVCQSREAPRPRGRDRPRRWAAVAASALGVAAATVWLGSGGPRRGGDPMSAELERARQASLRMHVAEVAPTDALFREPVRAFSGGSACWRVAIRDARNRPVAAARVQIDVVTPDGAVTRANHGNERQRWAGTFHVSAGRGRNRRRIHCAGGSRVARHPRRRHVRPCRRHGSLGQLLGEPPREATDAGLTTARGKGLQVRGSRARSCPTRRLSAHRTAAVGRRARSDGPPPTRVRIETRDRETRQAIPARFYLTDAKGTPITPTGLIAYHKGGEHHFVAPGPFEAELAPGRIDWLPSAAPSTFRRRSISMFKPTGHRMSACGSRGGST